MFISKSRELIDFNNCRKGYCLVFFAIAFKKSSLKIFIFYGTRYYVSKGNTMVPRKIASREITQ